MDRCAECLLELVDAELLCDGEGTLRIDWYAFAMENAEPAITIFRGQAMCIKHAVSALMDEAANGD